MDHGIGQFRAPAEPRERRHGWFARALQALTSDQRAAVVAFVEALETWPAREMIRSSDFAH